MTTTGGATNEGRDIKMVAGGDEGQDKHTRAMPLHGARIRDSRRDNTDPGISVDDLGTVIDTVNESSH